VPDLPHGTVTLVFTDVEGSTQLVHRLDQRYEQVLADHRRLLHEAVAAAEGHVVDRRGDEFFMVFHDARSAAEAIMAAQRAFAEHTWPDGVELRVRVGMHTGEPTARAEGYIGLDVHRAARICPAGSGGQVLLSHRTREQLDAEHDLVDLGEHELPGLPGPERLYQLNVPGCRATFRHSPLLAGDSGACA
jgi:class 3 adenylate cyclase